ncbi:MAG: hypothetical protein JXR86_03520 [Spirochaetales bacterium]|nr:hypothetical protein [Spirochaetales bacterium]
MRRESQPADGFAGIYNDHEENIQAGTDKGLIPLYAAESSPDEWDHFEWSFLMEAENSGDRERIGRIREWNRYYRKFGRTTMGFGFYLFRKPFAEKL